MPSKPGCRRSGSLSSRHVMSWRKAIIRSPTSRTAANTSMSFGRKIVRGRRTAREQAWEANRRFDPHAGRSVRWRQQPIYFIRSLVVSLVESRLPAAARGCAVLAGAEWRPMAASPRHARRCAHRRRSWPAHRLSNSGCAGVCRRAGCGSRRVGAPPFHAQRRCGAGSDDAAHRFVPPPPTSQKARRFTTIFEGKKGWNWISRSEVGNGNELDPGVVG